MATKHQSIIRMYFNSAGVAVNPGGGGAYAESIANIRSKVAFERLLDEYARVVVTAQGNGAGAGKGIEIYDVTAAAQICEVIWDANALQTALAGTWTACNLTADSIIAVRIKEGADVGEQITVYAVDFQLEYQ